MCEQRQTCCGGPRRALNILNQATEAISFGIANTHRGIKNLFRDLSHAVQQRTAAGQHDPTRELSLPTCVFDLIGDVHQHFLGARLKNVAKDLSRELAWWTATD